MSFYHNRHFRRKNKINKSKNNFHKQLPSARFTDITDLDQACNRTVFLIGVLRLAAYDYFNALKRHHIASMLLSKALRDSKEHVRRWIELTIVTGPIQIEMAIASIELDGANSAAPVSAGAAVH